MKVRVVVAGCLAVLVLAGCGSQEAAAPVTSTVTAVSTATATVSQPPSTVVSTLLRTVPQTVVSTVQKTVTAVPKPTATISSISSSKPVNGTVKALGQAFDFNVVKATVLDVKIPMTVGSHEADAGQEFAGVLAQMCIQNAPAAGNTISWRPWLLEDADGGQYPAAESKYEDTPKPEYPFDGTALYVNGDCAKGWIVFQIPVSAKPVHVRYSVADPNLGALLGLWNVKA